jgi:hypothetical protein
VVFLVWLVLKLVTLTAAPAMMAPFASVTVPVTPLDACPKVTTVVRSRR